MLETYADIGPFLQLSHRGVQLTATLFLTVNLKRCSLAIPLKSSYLAGEFRPIHAVLGLLTIRIDLLLQRRLDCQELGAHCLRVTLRSFRLPLPASWGTPNHRVPALAGTC